MSQDLATLISAISESLVGLSALVVAAIAIIGLRQWRAELTGRTRFELARKIVLLAYQFRDEFYAARSPFTFGGESADRPKDESESKAEQRVKDEQYARFARLRPLRTTARQLHEAAWEAEVMLDKDVQRHLQPLEDAFRELVIAMETHFHYQQGLATGRIGSYQLDDERLKKLEMAVYGGGSDDQFVPVINANLERLTGHLKRYLK